MERHAVYYRRRAQELGERVSGAGDEVEAAMRGFQCDIDNMRAGMDWASLCGDAASAVAYGVALGRFLLRRCLHSEGDVRLATAENAARGMGDRTALARLLNQRGLVAWQQGDLGAARRRFAESLDISRALDDRPRMLVTLINLGNIAWARGDFDEARRVWREALGAAAAAGQSRYEATLHTDLGMLACACGDLEAAERHLAAGLALHRRHQDEEGVAFNLLSASELSEARSEPGRAAELIEESRRIFQALGHDRGVALASVRTAVILVEIGSAAEARPFADEGLRIARGIGDRQTEMLALEAQARVAAAGGDVTAARSLFEMSFSIARETGNAKHQADMLLGLGELLTDAGHVEQAYPLLGVAARELAARGVATASIAAARQAQVGAGLVPAARCTLDQAIERLSLPQALDTTSDAPR